MSTVKGRLIYKTHIDCSSRGSLFQGEVSTFVFPSQTVMHSPRNRN